MFKGSNKDVENIIINYKKDMEAWDKWDGLRKKLNVEFKKELEVVKKKSTWYLHGDIPHDSNYFSWELTKYIECILFNKYEEDHCVKCFHKDYKSDIKDNDGLCCKCSDFVCHYNSEFSDIESSIDTDEYNELWSEA